MIFPIFISQVKSQALRDIPLRMKSTYLESREIVIYLKLIRVAAWETTASNSLNVDLMTAVPIVFSHGRDIIFSLDSPLLPSEIGFLLRKGLGPLSVLVNFGGRGPLYRRSAEVNNVSEAVPRVDLSAAHYKSDPTGTLPTPF